MPRKNSKARFASLFCGCGGLTAGLRKAGFRVLAAVDNDPLSMRTYKANHRLVRRWEGDIRQIDPADMLRELGLNEGELDLLAGCRDPQ